MGISPAKHVLTGVLDADWKMCAEFFEDSQSSRDIDVSNTTIEDWKQFFILIANHPEWPVHIGKNRAALPEVVPELFERSTREQLFFSFPISAEALSRFPLGLVWGSFEPDSFYAVFT